MKKLAIVLLLFSAPVWAEWSCVTSSDGEDHYADLATIRKRDNTSKIWVLIDYKTAQQVNPFPPFLSAKRQQEFNCDGDPYRLLFSRFIQGGWATGKLLSPTQTPLCGNLYHREA